MRKILVRILILVVVIINCFVISSCIRGSDYIEPKYDTGGRDTHAYFGDAGFIVMTPSLRGENGNPGNFELFYGEVDYLINAGKYLASQQYIDTNKIYLAGHSAGGTVAMLVALRSSPYSKIATFGAAPDIKQGWEDYMPFDSKKTKEIELRSAVKYIENLQKSLYIYSEKDDKKCIKLSNELIGKSGKVKEKIKLKYIKGNHFTSLKESINESCKVFKDN